MNKYLVRELQEIGHWTPTIRDKIMRANGSIQDIAEIPPELKAVFKTVWEVSQSELIEMNAARMPFVDQSVSFNLYIAKPATLTSALFKSWRSGCKGSYYTRTRAASAPLDFSAPPCLTCTA